MNKVIGVVALLGMLSGTPLLVGCDPKQPEASKKPEASRPHQYNGKCDDNLTSDQILAMRRRGENPLEHCH